VSGSDTAVPATPVLGVQTGYGRRFRVSNTAISSNVLTLNTLASDPAQYLHQGMKVIYYESSGGGWGLTDEGEYYLRRSSAASLLYYVYEDEDCTWGEEIALSGSVTPNGTEYFVLDDEYIEKILIAGHPVDANQVTVYLKTDAGYNSEVLDVTVEADGLSRLVSTVDVSTLRVSGPRDSVKISQSKLDSENYAVAWTEGPAALAVSGSGAVVGVGDLLRDLAVLARVQIDITSWKISAGELPQPVGYYIEEDKPAMEIALDIVDKLPVGIYSSAEGTAIKVINTEARSDQCISLIDGLNCHRDSDLSIVLEPDDQASLIEVNYGLDIFEQDYSSKVGTLYSPYGLDQGESTDVYIRTSGVQYTNQIETEELDWTYSQNTARKLAKWISRQKTVSPKSIELLVKYKLARELELGTPVKYTNTELSIDEAVGFVSSREISESEFWKVEIYFLYGVASDSSEKPSGATTGTPTPIPGGP